MTRLAAGAALGEVIRFILPGRPEPGFTARDRLDLQLWAQAAHHKVQFTDSEEGEFALLYRSEEPWAHWAAMRQDGKVLIWDAVSLADIGRFGSMQAALSALAAAAASPLKAITSPPNVIPFRPIQN